jgi:septal ring factor EnvC (AmiA/AmiB activator)
MTSLLKSQNEKNTENEKTIRPAIEEMRQKIAESTKKIEELRKNINAFKR